MQLPTVNLTELEQVQMIDVRRSSAFNVGREKERYRRFNVGTST